MASTFMAMVYSTLKEQGVDTNKMTPTECVKKFNELNNNNSLTKEEQDNSKKQQVQKLVDILKSIKKIKMKELVEIIKKLKPIELHTNDKDILAEFDKYSANKNVYTRGNSTQLGYDFKLGNIKDLPGYIKNSTYSYSKQEEGKTSLQHKDVKEWHYFVNSVTTEKGVFDIVINIRDKGANQYVYEVTFRENKKD